MKYGTIKPRDIANGIGVRVSLFVSGCTHHCKGCFNQETWNFDYGNTFNKETEDYIINELKNNFISGLSLLGGEPFETSNQEALIPFLERVKKEVPCKTIWVYSGYTFEQIKSTDMIKFVDVLVDGPFIEELKDIRLKFRGSSNQRIIDVQKTIEEDKIILLEV